MRSLMRLTVIVLALLVPVSCVYSQEIRMPDGGALPTRPAMDKTGQKKLFCWIASEVEKPKYSAGVDAENVFASSSFDWMETLYVMAEHSIGDDAFVLVARPRGDRPPRIEGWVRKGVLIIGDPTARRVLVADESGGGKRTRTSRLFQKVRLSNTDKSLRVAQGKDSRDVSKVPLYRSPEVGDASREMSLATLFYVYGEYKGFVLVGRTDNFQFTENKVNTDNYKEHVVIGWVPSDRIVRWNTRQAVTWNWWSTSPKVRNRRSTAGVVFGQFEETESKEDLILDEDGSRDLAENLHRRFSQKDGAANDAPEILYREPFVPYDSQSTLFNAMPSDIKLAESQGDQVALDALKVSKPMHPSEPRHPILEKYADLPYNNVLYRIGYSAGFSDQNIDLPKLRTQLSSIKDAIGKLDLMVLVDQTSSMKECFPEIAQAVALIFRGVTAGEAKDVRISVSFYGDQEARAEIDGDGQSAFEINPFVALETEKAQQATDQFLGRYLGQFRKIKNEDDFDALQRLFEGKKVDTELVNMLRNIHFHDFQGGGDPLEDVFKGIQYASRGNFRSQSMKLLLVLGDRGDKAGEITSKKVLATIGQIADKLKGGANNLPTDLVAINVAVEPERRDAALFTEQMNALQLRLNPDAVGIKGANRFETLANLIKDQYDKLLKQKQQMESDIRDLGDGEFSAEIGPQLRRLLESKGINTKKLKNTTGNEIFQRGFVWHYQPGTGVAQIRTQVLLKEKELCELIALLDRAFGESIYNEELNGRLEALIKAIEISSGQMQDKSGTLEDILTLSLDLPCSSPLMTLTETKLNEKSETEEGRAWLEREYCDIRVKLKRLKDLCEVDMDSPSRAQKPGFWTDWRIQTKVGSDGVPYTAPISTRKKVRVKRAFSYPNDETGTRWYWIDLLEEYP